MDYTFMIESIENTNKINKKSINESIKVDYTYSNDIQLTRYLDDLSYMIYGVSYNDIKFLNGNRTDFSRNNVLINPY